MSGMHDPFDQRIHDAYDRIELSEDAQDRMLANLMAAQARKQFHEVPSTSTEFESPTQATIATDSRDPRKESDNHKTRKRGGMRTWLPRAAAVVAVLVVVSVVGGSLWGGASSPMVASSGANDAKSTEALSEDMMVVEESAAEADGEASPDESVGYAADAAASNEAEELQLVDLYPRIVLEDGTQFTTLVDGMYTTEVNASEVGERVGSATASPFDSTDTVACEVYRLLDDPDGYAVRYADQESYWYCSKS